MAEIIGSGEDGSGRQVRAMAWSRSGKHLLFIVSGV
jgi:hypothetical protein